VAKHPKEIENRVVTPFPFKRPESTNAVVCKCGCGCEINTSIDSYIIVDGDLFLDDGCVTNWVLKEAGGRRVYGGAC
jgi:hypothetical protein